MPCLRYSAPPKRSAAARRAAVVEREHHVALLRQVLVEVASRGRPGARDGLRGRAAVDVDHHRILLRRIEAGRLDQAVVQRRGRRRRSACRTRSGGARRGTARRDAPASCTSLSSSVASSLPSAREQLDLRRRGRVGPAVDEDAGVVAERGVVHAGRRASGASVAPPASGTRVHVASRAANPCVRAEVGEAGGLVDRRAARRPSTRPR